jgi:DNA replication protein
MTGSSRAAQFTGFPAGALKATPVPNLFFSAVLPDIDDLSELKLVLHIMWRIGEKKGYPRFVTFAELVADAARLRIAGDGSATLEKAVAGALQAAARRGTLLQLSARFSDRVEDIYFVNSAEGRRAIGELRRGEIDIGQELVEKPEPVAVRERRNIFTLYEQNIALLTPLIAEQLQDAEKLYPAEWIAEAFQLAVEYNRRNWRYIQRILERWASEGRSNAGKRR